MTMPLSSTRSSTSISVAVLLMRSTVIDFTSPGTRRSSDTYRKKAREELEGSCGRAQGGRLQVSPRPTSSIRMKSGSGNCWMSFEK